MRVVGLCGSLRAASFNLGLLRAAGSMLPEGVTLEVVDIGHLPLMNEDLERPAWPEPVQAFRRAMWTADALLIASPEYNAGIPAALKNAIDWASRGEGAGGTTAPPGEARRSPLQAIPVAVMGATTGLSGTVRMQGQLRQVLQSCGARVMPQPEVQVRESRTRFDAEFALTDEASRAALARLVAALVEWAALVGPRRAT